MNKFYAKFETIRVCSECSCRWVEFGLADRAPMHEEPSREAPR